MLDLYRERALLHLHQPVMNLQEPLNIISGLDLINCPAIWIDRNGAVLAVSGKASRLFDSEFFVRGKRLYVADYQSRMRFEELIDRLRLEFEERGPLASQVVINRSNRRPMVIQVILKGGEAGPCRAAGALLLLTDLDDVPVISQASLIEIFSLTPVQAQVASLLVRGKSLAEIAGELKISSGTARNHLKAVFVRTATRRQGELVSLLSRLRLSISVA